MFTCPCAIVAPIMVPHRSPTDRGRRVNIKWCEVMSWFWVLTYVLCSAIWRGRTWEKIAVEFYSLCKQCHSPHRTHPPFPCASLVRLPQNAPPGTDRGGIDTPPSPNCHLARAPQKCLNNSTPPNSVISGTLGTLCPHGPSPLNSLCSQKKTSPPSLAAGFRNKV